MDRNKGGGYYTVLVGDAADNKTPHFVFAASDYHAARLIHLETGYLPRESDVQGPL